MNYDQPYWNPVLETLPRETLRELSLKKFQRIFRWTYIHSKSHGSLGLRRQISCTAERRNPSDG